MKIILGSRSKNRKNVLAQMGYKFDCLAADIDEKAIRSDDPQKLALELAHAKAKALLPKIKESALLITSDQIVWWKGQIREKPADATQAREYLRTLSEFPSQTITSVVVNNTTTGKAAEGVDSAKVYFKTLPDHIIEKLIQKGEVFKRAGGYDVDDPTLKLYVEKIEGEFESVLGLPKKLTLYLIKKAELE